MRGRRALLRRAQALETRFVSGASGWHLVDVGADHRDEVRGLFARVFGSDMAPALWHWKYAGGRGLASGTRDGDGRLLAHYGGMTRTLLVGGVPMGCVQVGDVMVEPEVRGVLSRRGPFATAARGFIERHIGTPEGFACGFGFPNERAARLGELLGLYARSCQVMQVRWPQAPSLSAFMQRWKWRLAPVDWSDAQTDARLERLWTGLRSDTGTGGCVLPERNAAWWRHRFANHPLIRYSAFWVYQRFSGRLLGAVVLRPGASPGDDWELLDWLALEQDSSAVVAAARGLCARHGARAMSAWLSEPLAVRLLSCPGLSDAQSELACTAIVSVRRRPSLLDAPPPRLWWWLTGGDTDFR